ncbi:MAG: hypothetical protein AB1578_07065 [Thermodesulfobacteriota bacterium]
MITDQDLKLLQSERLTDYEDGGGRLTGNEVVDGEVNNLFPDISELDRVYGRVSLRKGFLAVLTDTVDTLYGTHAAITDPPDDGSVNVTMFTRRSWTDERNAAKDRIESYVISGPESRFVLYGDHLEGQRALRVYCDTDVPSPEVGEVYRLSIEKTGYTPEEQFVRVQALVDRSTQTFSEMIGSSLVTFSKDVVIFETSAALRTDFPGGVPTKLSKHTSPTLVRTTQVADAARYFGVRPLVDAAQTGDLLVQVGSAYAPLVPSTQSETPVVDVPAGMGKVSLVPSGSAGALTWSGALTGALAGTLYAAARYLGMGCAKGSVSVTVGSVTLTDDGSGALHPPAGDASGYAGTVDYATGLVTVTRTSSWTATVTISARPAARTSDVAHTYEIAISLGNRGFNYVPTLRPIPSPGSLTVDYRALGKWIRLTDNGRGQLSGRTGEGTGTIDYATGSVIVTLGALPDVGSSIVFSWGTPVHYEIRAGDVAIAPGAIAYTVANPGIKPSTLSVTWLQGGVQKTATDNGTGGFTGDASAGTVDYVTGEIRVRPATAPDPNSAIVVNYDQWQTHTDTVTATLNTRTFTMTIGGANLPLRPGTVVLESPLAAMLSYPLYRANPLRCVDDGAGNLTGPDITAGAVDYVTGEVTLTVAAKSTQHRYWATSWGWGYETGVVLALSQDRRTWHWKAQEDAVGFTARSESTTHDGVTFDVTPLVVDQVVPGSLRFAWAGQTYVDREGAVYRAVDPATNAGTLAGTVNYDTGVVKLTDYVAGANTLAVSSLLTAFGAWDAWEVFFRTPGAPLKPASFSLRAVRTDTGETITATADVNGTLAAAQIAGTVDQETGVVRVRFGALVADAGLTAEEKAQDWYDPADVVEGMIWRPLRVIPSSIQFNAVIYSFVPIDASILGIDPVRLPQDGRVPIYRSGDVLLVHHTTTTEVATPTAGATVNLRARISFAKVRDAAGAPVPSDRYTTDLVAGTLTWADPLDLTGFTLPLTITHRIEDLLLCSDVQITGELATVAALTHDYPADASYASSCLLIGDLQARVEKFHDLQTFTSWSDTPTGSEAAANFNTVLYPVEVTNRGAVEERWRITFADAATVNVIGEVYGQIATGVSILNDVAPLNPQTGVPYFRLRKEDWGGGWSTGNTVRFNTRGANYPIWFCRTTLQGPVEAPDDHFKVQIRGDAD